MTAPASRKRRLLRVLLLYGIPLAATIVVRLSLPSYYEFESQEDTARAAVIVERGELPLYGIGHVRFLGAALGPLIYYVKAIPHLFTADPAGEVVFLCVLRLAALVLAMLLAGAIARDMESARGAAPERARRFGERVAFVTGLALAFSVHAQGLTSHPHPSYFASCFMVGFLYTLHGWLRGGSHRWLIGAGICLGIMTQFYQLTLFAPGLLVILAVVTPRRPTRRDLAALVLPFLICYLPYFLSELTTGFWNTANFFTFQPGPRDAEMVVADRLFSLRYLLNTAVEYVGIPYALDLVLMFLTAAGLARLGVSLTRSSGARQMTAFLIFYGFLPAVFLGAPRFQLSLPAVPFVVALGIVTAAQLLTAAWRRSTGGRLGAVAVLLVLAAASYLFGRTHLDGSLRAPLSYPSRMVMAHPVGNVPTLAQSRDVLRFLNREHGIHVGNLSTDVESPVVGPGFYGHHYLLRSLQDPPGDAERRRPPQEGLSREGGGLSPPSGGTRRSRRGALFIHDDRFPYRVHTDAPTRQGPFTIARLPADRLPADSFRLTVACDHEWCKERSAPRVTPPRSRFFWGCAIFRDLEPRLGIPPGECEDLLTAPPHDSRWEGTLDLPAPAACPGCREVLFVTVHPRCATRVTLDDVELPATWLPGHERKYAFIELPPAAAPGRHRITFALDDCVPYIFRVVQFTGTPAGGASTP